MEENIIQANKAEAMMKELKKVIIGKDEILEKVLMAVLSKGHVLLEDVPGVGKTTLALAMGRTLGLDFKRVQFTPDTMPSDIIGFSVYEKQSGELVYKKGAIMTNLLLADEINRTSSRTQAALLEVMEEGTVTVDAVTHEVPKPFVVIATQNPIGSAGTQILPSAQLDRFMIRLKMGYPDFQSQIEMMKERHHGNPLDSVNKVMTKEEIIKLQEQIGQLFVADEIYEYIANLAKETREHPLIQLGISPRAMLAICQMAKAHAYFQNRSYVIPEDVRDVFLDVCSHRVILYAKAKITEKDPTEILTQILQKVSMPLLRGLPS